MLSQDDSQLGADIINLPRRLKGVRLSTHAFSADQLIIATQFALTNVSSLTVAAATDIARE
jgi:hypothetical protein